MATTYRDPLAAISTGRTPQTQPVPGRGDQIRNHAGGYVFERDLWQQAEDFTVLGTTGGEFYLGTDQLAAQGADVLFKAVREDGPRLVELVRQISVSRPPRAPKPRAALFALAAASAAGDRATVGAVRDAGWQMARTTDHLAMLFGYRKQLRNKTAGRGLAPVASHAWRSTLAAWFLALDVDQVAWKACKARQRKTPAGERFELRDALRISHPRSADPQRRALLGWIAGNVTDAQAAEQLPAVDAFLAGQAAGTPAKAIRVISDRKIPWEFLPSDVLADAGVWEALAATTGLTAVIRNLARMTRIGTLGPFAAANKIVAARLTDAEALAAARIHPMDLYLAARIYASGISQPNPARDPERWQPVPEVLDAADEAYNLSFGHTQPSGRRLVVAVDSSGSMAGGYWGARPVMAGGSPIGTPYQVACALAAQVKRIERDNAWIIDVDTSVRASRITARTTVSEMSRWSPSGGGTDLSLPFTWAERENVTADGFLTLTDMETWAGGRHPFEALTSYRRTRNPAARVIIAATAPYGHTIGEPGDPGVLNVAGMDATLPSLVAGFIREN